MNKPSYAVATYYYDPDGNHYFTDLRSDFKRKKNAEARMWKQIKKHTDGESIIKMIDEDTVEITWCDSRRTKIELIELW